MKTVLLTTLMVLVVNVAEAGNVPSFAELKVTMRCNWYMGVRREVTFKEDGNGKAVYRMMTQNNEEKYRAEFMLSDGQRASLLAALAETQWLKQNPEDAMVRDGVECELELRRRGETTSTKCVDHQTKEYQKLLNILRTVERQEYRAFQLTASTRDQRSHAARDIQSELSSRMKHPERKVAEHLKHVNYQRFVPSLTPWLTDYKKYSRDELAAAIDLVGYLKLALEREKVEALMGKAGYSNWDSVGECLVRLGDPRSIAVLQKRAMKSGGGAACWALIRMGEPAHKAICDVLKMPPVPNKKPAYKMIRVYLDHFHELPAPVAPVIVEAIHEAGRHDGSTMDQYADRLLRLIDGVKPVQGLRVTIELQQEEYMEGKPIPVKWKIENTGNEARIILWHPLHYSPIVFSFMTAGGVEHIRVDSGRHIIDSIPLPPEVLTFQSGESREVTVNLQHFMNGLRPGTYVIAGYYWPQAKEAGISAVHLQYPKFKDAVLERIGSPVAELVVRRKPRTAEEEKREALRLQQVNRDASEKAETAKRRAIEAAKMRNHE
jgi:hypothetical protein